MRRNRKVLGSLLTAKPAFALAAVAMAHQAIEASCWSDAQVTALAMGVAQSGFPNAAARMPEVLVCDGGDFGPGIGGDYTGGVHKIRIPQWQLNGTGLRSVLAHELAHAETWLTGGSGANNGHSVDFMRALLRAGWHGEAQRVGQHVYGAQAALNEARASLSGQGSSQRERGDYYRPPNNPPVVAYTPPMVQVQVCHDQQRMVYHLVAPGIWQRGIETQRVCHWVTSQ